MKCPHCKTNVVNIPINWKCPHCNEKLPEPGFLANFFEGLGEYLVERGAIFWGIVFGAILLIIGTGEIIFSHGFLLKYIAKNMIFAIIMIFFGGMLIDMYMKVVLPLHLPFGSGAFILKERSVIRNIRKATHITGAAGFIVALFWLGPRTFLEYFPSYLLVLSVFLGFAWSISGLFLDPRMTEDVRFRHYMDRLGITSLKALRKLCTIVIGGLFVSVITFWALIQIPGLWNHVSQWTVVAGAIFFAKAYLGWLM